MSSLAKVQEILCACGLPDTGAVSFSRLSNRLISCRAAARLEHDSPAKTVLVMVFPYRFADTGVRNLCRYACVEDYHVAAGAVLETAAAALRAEWPDRWFEPFIDNSPVPEVTAAALAGLGVVGDNGLLIHPTYGSWVVIGCVVTDMEMDVPTTELGGCLHCGACAAACPSGCLSDPSGDRPACLSAVTQRKGDLTEQEKRLLRENGLVWGCDRCQEACPMNADAVIRPHPCFTDYRPLLTQADLSDLQNRAYTWRGVNVLMRNLSICEKIG